MKSTLSVFFPSDVLKRREATSRTKTTTLDFIFPAGLKFFFLNNLRKSKKRKEKKQNDKKNSLKILKFTVIFREPVSIGWLPTVCSFFYFGFLFLFSLDFVFSFA